MSSPAGRCMTVAISVAVEARAPDCVIASATQMLAGETARFPGVERTRPHRSSPKWFDDAVSVLVCAVIGTLCCGDVGGDDDVAGGDDDVAGGSGGDGAGSEVTEGPSGPCVLPHANDEDTTKASATSGFTCTGQSNDAQMSTPQTCCVASSDA